MLDRFADATDGNRRVVDALGKQLMFRGDISLITEVADIAKIEAYAIGEDLILQGAADTSLLLILAGEVSVLIGGTEVGRRRAGTHVGEMAMIDPSKPRSATVRATLETVVARVAEHDFVRVADRHPHVWRAISVELAERIRLRIVRVKNTVPSIFIGCSAEALNVAQKIQSALDRDALCTIWTDDVFKPSNHTMEDLEQALDRADFAVLVARSDDIVTSRGVSSGAPRDNVILELGLAIGALGRERTFIVTPREAGAKLPSDLLGIKPIDHRLPADDADLRSALGPVATAIRERVKKLGPR